MALHFEFLTAGPAQAAAMWAATRIPGCERGFGPCATMVVRDRDRIAGMVVFHNYSPEAGVMEMSAAGEHWLNRSVLYAIHKYVFEDAGCQLAVMRISEKNARMLRIAKAYGYAKHHIPRLRGRDEAEVIATLTEEDWRASRFHKRQEHGKTEAPGTA